jgi:DHA1 family bicyclomycin/chloramphenicol resistance-like MFS transporter
MAVVRDLFDGLAFAKLFSRLMLVIGAAPISGADTGRHHPELDVVARSVPCAGGVRRGNDHCGRARAARDPPTGTPAQRWCGGTLRDYRRLFTDRTYIGLIVVAGLAMASLFAYVSGSSFVFQEQYGLSQQWFGFTFGAGAIGLIAATQLNVRLLRRWSPVQVLVAALGFGAVAGLVLVLFAATGTGGLAGVLVPLWLVIAAAGLAMPNAPALALSRHGDTAGTAAALLGAVQFGVGALAAPLVGLLGVGAVAMAVVVAGGMVAANVVLAVVVRPWRCPPGRFSSAAPAH